MSAGSELPTSWTRCQLGDVVDYGSTDKAEPSEINADDWILELEDIDLMRMAFVRQRSSLCDRHRKSAGDTCTTG